VFRYTRPDLAGKNKTSAPLAKTDIARVEVQIIAEGGDNNLHSHHHVDGFRFVLSGRVRFYTTDDRLIADLGPGEGIVVPRNTPYWLESSGDEPLEIVHLEAYDEPVLSIEQLHADRVDYAPRKANQIK